MRSEPVPCIHATDYEINLGKHITWDDDRLCNPCRRVLDIFAERRAMAEVEGRPIDDTRANHPSMFRGHEKPTFSAVTDAPCSCYLEHGFGECPCEEHPRSERHPYGEVNG